MDFDKGLLGAKNCAEYGPTPESLSLSLFLSLSLSLSAKARRRKTQLLIHIFSSSSMCSFWPETQGQIAAGLGNLFLPSMS